MKLHGLHKPKLLKRLKIGHALWKSVKEFLLTTYVHSYHYLADAEGGIPEKVMWLIVHFITLFSAINIVTIAWGHFTDNPTITTLESQHYSIYNLPFPALAICSNNKLSNESIYEYADYLYYKGFTKYDKEKLIKMIQYMGRLYDSEIEDFDDFTKFQEILDTIDTDKKTGIFDSQAKLAMLAPKCDDILLKCKWGGALVNCSSFLQTRLTYEGFCCTFNYVRPSSDNETVVEAKAAAGVGPDMGLTILLNLSIADYAYTLKNFAGASAFIFDPYEFCDSSSGSVREVPLERFVETRVTVTCVTKKAVEDVQRYSIEKRECLFPTDMMNEYNGNYVYGDCLTKCKLKSILALCKCIPFNLPTNFPGIDTTLPFCSLSNLQCMNKYKIKWATYKPREYIKVLEREMEDSINCVDCYPLCSSTSYIVDSTSAKLNFFYQNKGSILTGLNESNDLSVLKVYFPESDSVLYKTDVLYAWYDIISEYGGLLGLFLGCSIVTVFEIIFFLTIRFYQNLFSSSNFMNKFQKHKPTMFDNKVLYRAKFDYIQ
ncbi:hypothetical protein PVAND_012983 [Polypedilum vanderplanki]|uniref:Uncharacterized protein n=1 Tax=Polypedilum vanderplanki TaxID=319348 RepID=A0A9J6CQ35_POLVA|nr:hypothetical protein PVAND_012983 [Polypedilum vanderplanki]